MPSTTPAKAKKPQDHKPKNQFGKKQVFTIELPSGSTIGVTRPGVQGLIKDGVLHSLDSLTGIVQTETIPGAEGKKKIEVSELAKNSDKISEMMEAMDKIVLTVVVDPPLYKPVVTQEMISTPDHETPFTIEDMGRSLTDAERDPELAYIDYVDENDKSFIMQFALGGSSDLATFRKATEEAMGGVSAVEAVDGSPESAL